MENNSDEGFLQIRLPVDRRMAIDRRLLHRHDFLDNNTDRRVNIIDRRIHGDRREFHPSTINSFVKEAF